jgi:osmotically-inducible protein OsmY
MCEDEREMNKIRGYNVDAVKGAFVMFMSFNASSAFTGAGRSGLRAAVASAIAYGTDMQDVNIEVSEIGGTLVLEGTAGDDGQIQRATDIARDIAGAVICRILKA